MKLQGKKFPIIFIVMLVFLSAILANAASDDDYKLAAGDSVRVLVFQNPELTVDTRVSESGSITVPLVGEIKVGGISIQDAEKKIADALKSGGFVQQPQVNIVLLQVLGNRVAVFGLVNKPGRYPLDTSNIHLSEMIATAGGVYISAGNGTVWVNGIREGKQINLSIDLASVVLSHDKEKDILLASGDVLYVTPGNQVSVVGLVNRPGRYALDQVKMSLPDVIALAGGVQPGVASDIVVISGYRDGLKFTKQVDLADIFLNPNSAYDDLNVQAGDQLYVHRAPTFYIYGEAQRPGSYRVERGMTVVQALAMGGGPTTRGTQRSLKIYRKNAEGVIEKIKPELTDSVQADDVLYVEESLF